MNPEVPTPPYWAKRLLRWLHPEGTLEEVEGDLEELYTYWYHRSGQAQAMLRYLLNVVSVLPPFVRQRERKETYPSSTPYLAMIRNYLKIALRNLWKSKTYSFINIFGLSTGLATCLLIMLYIGDESSYDKHHKAGERIFRVALRTSEGESWAAGPGPLAWGLKNDWPEVEQAARLLTFPDIATMLVKYEQGSETKEFFEINGYYVDSTFFQLFTYDFKYGSEAIALTSPGSIVISTVLADKYFGDEYPIGKSLKITTPFGEVPYTVSGVFDTASGKSHIPANFFLTMRNNDMWNWVQRQTSWTTNNIFYTYIKLREGVDAKTFEKKLGPFLNFQAGAEAKVAGFSKTLFLQPVQNIWLYSSLGFEIAANGNVKYLYILGSIGLFILLIACINFMNLSTARSQNRAREVGVRKVMGAKKSALVRQFLGESLFMCFMSLGLSLGLVLTVLPLLNNLIHKDMRLFADPVVILWSIGLATFTGLLAGFYPAFYLSAFKPVLVLKGKLQNSFTAAAIRKGLVTFQFIISIGLVISAVTIGQQLNLLKNQNLGFDKKQKIILPLQQSYVNSEQGFSPLKDELVKIPGVDRVTCGSSYPGILNLSDMLFYAEGKTTNDVVDVHLSAIGNDYIETLGMDLVSGRSFSQEYKGDSAGIILNEVAVDELGYDAQSAIGKKIRYDTGDYHGSMQIIGVVKNFNFESLHTQIKPCGFTSGLFGNEYGYLIASVKTRDYTQVLKEMEDSWNQLNPSTPFVYSFLDQDFQRNYEKEYLTSSIIGYFTCIAILIACLGLYGLVAFSAEQRTKEIGIRKVLGASVADIVTMLSRDFVKLVLAAIVLACPLAWYAMNRWLGDFAYKVDIGWWIFAASGLGALVIALLTVSYQSIKAALMNPVKSLRSE